MSIPIIYCGFGLANRVSAMANALSRFDRIKFSWKINHECNLPLRDVFPNGVLGVEFIENAKPAHATSWDGRLCSSWDSAYDRQKAIAAYRTIMDSMAGEMGEPEPFALCCRFHYAGFDVKSVLEKTLFVAETHGFKKLFLLADSRRAELSSRLLEHGIESVLPSSSEMASDFDRTYEDQCRFLSDWKRFTGASVIVANPPVSGLIHPARSFGAKIYPVTF
jgi:hypothetical protein